jgi:hypothetical protein
MRVLASVGPEVGVHCSLMLDHAASDRRTDDTARPPLPGGTRATDADLTAESIAHFIHSSENYVRQAMRTKRLPAWKTATGRWETDVRSLVAWLRTTPYSHPEKLAALERLVARTDAA